MTTKTITPNFVSEVPLDLRAPGFAKLRKGSWWLRLITLVSLDSILLFIAWVCAESYPSFGDFPWATPSAYSPILISIVIQIVALAIQGIYQSGKNRCDYLNIVKTLIFAHGLILLVATLSSSAEMIDINQSQLILSLLLSVGFICSGRLAVDITLAYLRQKRIFGNSSVFIICNPEDNDKFINFIKKEKHYVICGSASAKALDRYHRQETLEKLNQLGVTEVFIAWDAIKNRMFLRWLFQTSGITVHLLSMELNQIYKDAEYNQIGGMSCLSLDCPIITGKDFWFKRCLDFCVASALLLLLLPLYIVIAIAIKLDSPGSVFYKQTRIGLHGKPFKVWKFRTMRSDAEKLQRELEALNESKDGIIFKIKQDPRITRVGHFLRRYSLDELPQLFNVLFGEMSLVGPRPLPTRDVNKFAEHHFIRQEVLPGITGLWQVSGRSNIIDFEQVVNLDISYIENWSIWLDFQILLKTVVVVLRKEGAY